MQIVKKWFYHNLPSSLHPHVRKIQSWKKTHFDQVMGVLILSVLTIGVVTSFALVGMDSDIRQRASELYPQYHTCSSNSECASGVCRECRTNEACPDFGGKYCFSPDPTRVIVQPSNTPVPSSTPVVTAKPACITSGNWCGPGATTVGCCGGLTCTINTCQVVSCSASCVNGCTTINGQSACSPYCKSSCLEGCVSQSSTGGVCKNYCNKSCKVGEVCVKNSTGGGCIADDSKKENDSKDDKSKENVMQGQCYFGASSCSTLGRYPANDCQSCPAGVATCCGEKIPEASQVCTPNSSICANNIVRVCNGYGTGWQDQVCAVGTTCDRDHCEIPVAEGQLCSSPHGSHLGMNFYCCDGKSKYGDCVAAVDTHDNTPLPDGTWCFWTVLGTGSCNNCIHKPTHKGGPNDSRDYCGPALSGNNSVLQIAEGELCQKSPLNARVLNGRDLDHCLCGPTNIAIEVNERCSNLPPAPEAGACDAADANCANAGVPECLVDNWFDYTQKSLRVNSSIRSDFMGIPFCALCDEGNVGKTITMTFCATDVHNLDQSSSANRTLATASETFNVPISIEEGVLPSEGAAEDIRVGLLRLPAGLRTGTNNGQNLELEITDIGKMGALMGIPHTYFTSVTGGITIGNTNIIRVAHDYGCYEFNISNPVCFEPYNYFARESLIHEAIHANNDDFVANSAYCPNHAAVCTMQEAYNVAAEKDGVELEAEDGPNYEMRETERLAFDCSRYAFCKLDSRQYNHIAEFCQQVVFQGETTAQRDSFCQ